MNLRPLLCLALLFSPVVGRSADPSKFQEDTNFPPVVRPVSASEIVLAIGFYPGFEGEFESAVAAFDLRSETGRTLYFYSAYRGGASAETLINGIQRRPRGGIAFDREDIGAIEISGKSVHVGVDETSDFVIDAAGNVYRTRHGEYPSESAAVEKWSPNGVLVQIDDLKPDEPLNPNNHDIGTVIDLAADQCTLYHASSSWAGISRYNVCTRKKLTPVATSLRGVKGLRVLRDGGMIVAADTEIRVYSPDGKFRILGFIPKHIERVSFSVSTDGATVWVAIGSGISRGSFFRMSLADGAVIEGPYAAPLVDNPFGDDYPYPITAIAAFDDWRAAAGTALRRPRTVAR